MLSTAAEDAFLDATIKFPSIQGLAAPSAFGLFVLLSAGSRAGRTAKHGSPWVVLLFCHVGMQRSTTVWDLCSLRSSMFLRTLFISMLFSSTIMKVDILRLTEAGAPRPKSEWRKTNWDNVEKQLENGDLDELLVSEDKIAMDDYDKRRSEGLKLPEENVALK